MPEQALLMLATRQMNRLLGTHMTLEEVADLDPVWHVLARALRSRMGAEQEATE